MPALYVAWTRWRGGAMVPCRSDVRLEDIKPHLARMMVLEVRSPEETVFRLAGTHVVDHMGFDPTGMNYVDLTTPSDQPRRIERIRAQTS